MNRFSTLQYPSTPTLQNTLIFTNTFESENVETGVELDLIISDHQQNWGYEEDPTKGPGPCSAGDR